MYKLCGQAKITQSKTSIAVKKEHVQYSRINKYEGDTKY